MLAEAQEAILEVVWSERLIAIPDGQRKFQARRDEQIVQNLFGGAPLLRVGPGTYGYGAPAQIDL